MSAIVLLLFYVTAWVIVLYFEEKEKQIDASCPICHGNDHNDFCLAAMGMIVNSK